MTLITPIAGQPTTGNELRDFELNLDETSDNVIDLSEKVGWTEDRVGDAKWAMEQVSEIKAQAREFQQTVKSMQFSLKIAEKVGPLKLPAKFIGQVLDKVESVAKTIYERAKTLEQKIEAGEYIEKAEKAEETLGEVKDGLEVAAGKITELADISFNLNVVLNAVGAPLDGIEAEIHDRLQSPNDLLVTINTAYNDVNDDIQGVIDALNPVGIGFDALFGALSGVAGAFGSINSSLSFLSKPLQAVYNALKPVEWVLDAVGFLYNITVGPVVDYVLDKLGITAIFDRIGDAIASVLPKTNVLDQLISHLDGIFDEIEAMIDVDIGWDGKFDDYISDIEDQLFGDFTLDASVAMRFGTEGDDTLDGAAGTMEVLVGRDGDDLVRGAPVSGANDALDVFMASAGKDTIEGGSSDSDWMVLPGLLSDWSISKFSEAGPFIFYHRLGEYGWEVVRGVENFAFGTNIMTAQQLLDSGLVSDGPTTGPDYIELGSGDDMIAPLDGSDTVFAGSGRDTFVVSDDESLQPRAQVQVFLKMTNPRTDAEGTSFDQYAYTSFDSDYLDGFEDVLILSPSASVVHGSDIGNLIVTNAGNDTIRGMGGRDTIHANEGNDYIDANGWGEVYAGTDNDKVVVGGPVTAGQNSHFDGGSDTHGNDTDQLFYTGNRSNYDIYPHNDPFSSYAGDPVSSGRVRINAELGEVRRLNADATQVLAIDTFTGFEKVYGSDFDDTLRGTDDYDIVLNGADGNDVIYSDGATWIEGGAGDDTLYATMGGAAVDGGGGTDVLDLREYGDANWTIENTFSSQTRLSAFAPNEVERQYDVDAEGEATATTPVAEQVFSGRVSGVEIFYLGGGNDDLIHAGTGDMEVFGGAGDDRMVRNHANDGSHSTIFHGGAGNDTLAMFEEATAIYGDDGDDDLFLRSSGNGLIVDGGAGDDIVRIQRMNYFGTLDNFVRGGSGYDRVVLLNTYDTQTSLTLGADGVFASTPGAGQFQRLGGRLSGFEEIVGMVDGRNVLQMPNPTGGRLVGQNLADSLTGGDAADELYGNAGNDTLLGQGGDDRLIGGLGNDSLVGGAGIDTAVYATIQYGGERGDAYVTPGTFGGVQVSLTVNRSTGTFGSDTLSGIENLTGSTGHDLLEGDAGQNVLSGGAGGDTLAGAGGDDVLLSGDGMDVVFGGLGDDTIIAAPGNDTILGGGGIDLLDLTASAGAAEIDLATGTMLTRLAGQYPVWQDDGTTAPRVFDGQSMTPLDVLQADLAYANDDGDLARRLPDEGDYAADPALPGFEIRMVEWVDTHGGRIHGVEQVTGGIHDDSLRGAASNDTLIGGEGDDTLAGDRGADSLVGGAGNDKLHGELSNGIAPDIAAGVPLALLNTPNAGFDRIEVTGFTGLSGANFALEAVIQAENTLRNQALVSYATASQSNEFLLIQAQTRNVLQVLYKGQAFDTGVPISAIFDGAPHRISVVVETASSQMTIFVDGERAWTGSETIFGSKLGTGGTLVFGQDQDSLGGSYDPNQSLQGGIGDIRVYDRALPAELMPGRAEGPLPEGGAGISGLVGYWTMDPGAEAVVARVGPTAGIYGNYDFAEAPRLSDNRNDTLIGDAGDDILAGDEGDDLLVGGTGDDTINGGSGNDRIEGFAPGEVLTDLGMVLLNTPAIRDRALTIDTYYGMGLDLTLDMLILAQEDVPVAQRLLSYEPVGANGLGFDLQIEDDDTPYLYLVEHDGDGVRRIFTGIPKDLLTDGSLRRLTVTRDGDTGAWAFYLDGELKGEAVVEESAGVAFANGGSLVIGQSQGVLDPANEPTRAYRGSVGDIALYREALGESEIAARSVGALADPGHLGLASYWRPDAAAGTVNSVIGGRGFDVSAAGPFSSFLTATDGDEIYAGAGFDTVNAGPGHDLVMGGDQADVIRAQKGNDTVEGGTGADWVDLGTGNDLFRDDAQTGDFAGDTVLGGDGADTILGDGGNDRFEGGQGADEISGGVGADSLFGNKGDDSLNAGLGDDVVNGGNGRDSAWMGAGDDVYFDNAQGGSLGADLVYGGDGNDTINGGSGADTFDGGAGSDDITGGTGFDLLTGGGQGDTLSGQDGNDTVIGDDGADMALLGTGDDLWQDNTQRGAFAGDSIWAGAGDDTIRMGGGNDLATGGSGADRFVFGTIIDADVVTDFTKGEDALVLDDALWGGANLTGQQVVNQFATDTGSDVVFDFGGGHTITLLGMAHTGNLAEDIVIY
ncbi:LamG-like jellyroll fold domain-containing protein [Mesobacterium pallidum]|uniref:LamG-like jellyroll fold domain-containing protein n=1 Tax=Mesobacterium pallidum TaxID=2872037 RepID=UPI001EE2BA1C|nr:LamG-like jellyroll fold domain-containing protein [Mesobacterium pallidum]